MKGGRRSGEIGEGHDRDGALAGGHGRCPRGARHLCSGLFFGERSERAWIHSVLLFASRMFGLSQSPPLPSPTYTFVAKIQESIRSERIPDPGGLRVRLEDALKELTNIFVMKRELVLI